MSAAHCRRNGPWTAGAGSATRTQQRQVMDSKKQDSHPQYNSWAQDYDYMVLTIEGRFRKGFYLLRVSQSEKRAKFENSKNPCQL